MASTEERTDQGGSGNAPELPDNRNSGKMKEEEEEENHEEPEENHEEPESEEKRKLKQMRWMMEEAVEDGLKRQDETRSKRAVEIKIAPPKPFGSDTSEARSWLNTVNAYLLLNEEVYNTDRKKVIFAHSFMTEGTAAAWVNSRNEEALAIDIRGNRVGWGSWRGFEKNFLTSFDYGDQKMINLGKLQNLRQAGETNNIKDYITQFRTLSSLSGVRDQAAFIGYFQKGLKPHLMRQVFSLEHVPNTIEGWFAKANLFDNQNRMARSVEESNNQPRPYYQRNRSYNNPRPRNVNAIEVNGTTLSKEEKDRYFREALCFECGEKGHRAAACRNRQGPSRPRTDKFRTNIKATTTKEGPASDLAKERAIAIKALFHGISEEERVATLEELGDDLDF